jgi:8-amino-7-oxononanoate synthase
MLFERVENQLKVRMDNSSLRALKIPTHNLIDFSSNNYLGLANSSLLMDVANELLIKNNLSPLGSTGSRLLTGNSTFIEETETLLTDFFQGENGLIFNSGFDANLGILSTLPTKSDVILYDESIHTSMREGIRLSFAKSYSFKHNDDTDCERLIINNLKADNIFICLESIYSMEGDISPFQEFVKLKQVYPNVHLILDEAHSTGIRGINGNGLANEINISDAFLCILYTFGKAGGLHGAFVTMPTLIKQFMINYCRIFIYTTAPSYHQIASMRAVVDLFPTMDEQRNQLKMLSAYYNDKFDKQGETPIKSIIRAGNKEVKYLSQKCLDIGIDVRPILSPTVKLGEERLRVILHSFNTFEEVNKLFGVVS